MTAAPATFNPGDSVTLTLTIRGPSIRVGGAFITTGGVGSLRALTGEGLAEGVQGLTHTAPKEARDGAVTFRFAWLAPTQPGGVDFGVAAVAGNGNGTSGGDSPGRADFPWAFGCPSRTFAVDLDRDGYGSKELGTRLGCSDDAPPMGYAAMLGDCDENDESVRPGATEICNKKDDDCNGQVDEGAPPVMMWPDADGDGYYQIQTGASLVGCGNVAGYAPSGGDCDDGDATLHPGAHESCNNKDDDCDGEVDELVRPQCGLGWCSRYSPTCDLADCHPGPPAAEKCNHFDDDCDGEDDNAACSASQDPMTTPTPPTSAGSGSVSVAGAAHSDATGGPSARGCALSVPGGPSGWVWVVGLLLMLPGVGRRRT